MTKAVPRSGRAGAVVAMSSASLVQSGAAAASAVWATIVLGPAERGVMVLALTSAAMLALAGGIGTGPAYRGLLPRCTFTGRSQLASAYAWLSVGSSVLAAVGAVAVGLVTAVIIDPALGGTALLVVMAASAAAQCLGTQSLEAWFANGSFQWASWLAAGRAGLGFALLVAFGAVRPSPVSMLLGLTVGEGVGAIVSATLLARRRLLLFKRRPRRAEMAQLLRQGWPTLGINAGLILTFRADRYVLGAFSGPVAVTLYSLAATVSELCRTVPFALGQVVTRQVASRDPAFSLARTTRQAVVAVAATGALLAVVGWVAIPIVFGDDLRESRTYLVALLAAEVVFAPFLIASRGLVGGGWTRDTGVIGGVGCVIAVGSYLVLVPPFGIAGACLASFVSYLVLSTWTVQRLRLRMAGEASRSHDVAPVAVSARPERARIIAP